MKINLHCNLPYNPLIPNPAIGYLKSLLLGDKIEAKNIYWNLILYNVLLIEYAYLTEKYQKLRNCFRYDLLIAHISKYLYENEKKDKINDLSPSYFSSLIKSAVPTKELEKLSQGLKIMVDKYIEQEKLYNADIAGFTMKTSQWIINYYVLLRLKKFNPDITTIIGGIESASQALEFMRVFKEADFAIWGEGEVPIIDLLNNLDSNSYLEKVPNLVYRKENNIISTFPITSQDLPDIDSYPFANHDDYFNFIKKNKFNFEFPIRIPIWGTRSCYWRRCKFCVMNEGYIYGERSPDNIVHEIEYQANRHNVDHFIFVDTDFGRKSRDEFYKLLSLLVESSNKREKNYHIIGGVSPFRIERKSIEMMKKIDFEGVEMGFEATSDSLLKKMMKRQRFIHNIQALKLAEEQDFPLIDLNIIRYIPTETEEDVIESIKNLKFLRFFLKKYPFNFATLRIYKRSPFYEEMSKEQLREWVFSLYWQEMNRLEFLSEADRFEFFGFNKKDLVNIYLWEVFANILEKYQSEQFSYTWVEHPDGTSEIHEKGTYSLDKTETEILKICDTIKTISELRNRFTDLTEDQLKQIIFPLKDVGLIYVDNNFRTFISVVSSKNINRGKTFE